jgi:hypothetical protein
VIKAAGSPTLRPTANPKFESENSSALSLIMNEFIPRHSLIAFHHTMQARAVSNSSPLKPGRNIILKDACRLSQGACCVIIHAGQAIGKRALGILKF